MTKHNLVNTVRHHSLFDPNITGRIDVIGCGAIGSNVVLSIAKLGVENLHVWDFDNVESHNIANQLFSISDVGKPKVEAIREIVKANTGLEITAHNAVVRKKKQLGEIVVMCVDSMKARKEIFDNSLKHISNVKLVVETRMGIDSIRCYTICPTNLDHITKWEETLCKDEDLHPEDAGICQAPISVGATASIASNLATWQIIKWNNLAAARASHDSDRQLQNIINNEIIVSLRPDEIIARVF